MANLRKWLAGYWQLILAAAILVGTGLLAVTNATAQVIPQSAKREGAEVIILKMVTMKKGDTCPSVTKSVGHPLTHEECQKLLESIGRVARVDHRNPMMQIIIRPQFFPGDRLFYLSTDGVKGWAMKPVNTAKANTTL